MYVLGFDIGGTKCAVITAKWDGEQINILKKQQCNTNHTIGPDGMMEKIITMADGLLCQKPDAIGISCGGPLDAEKGIILSPPNLPGWDKVEIVKTLQAHFGAPAYLQNDANACALAEWKFGAGRGLKNMIFLTFGTGLGAGLILDGRLYAGTNGNAGEIGHIRLLEDGPIGYGKKGSFEGFCSGGGIRQLGLSLAKESIKKGVFPLYFQKDTKEEDVTAKSIANAALLGDETALDVYRLSGRYLGKGLSILIDILNPEKIVIGSIFARSEQLLREAMEEEIKKEALSYSCQCVEIVPAMLHERIGDYAAVATAITGGKNHV